MGRGSNLRFVRGLDPFAGVSEKVVIFEYQRACDVKRIDFKTKAEDEFIVGVVFV
jgi:hypothetical protein